MFPAFRRALDLLSGGQAHTARAREQPGHERLVDTYQRRQAGLGYV
jgi:hypothetical protein